MPLGVTGKQAQAVHSELLLEVIFYPLHQLVKYRELNLISLHDIYPFHRYVNLAALFIQYSLILSTMLYINSPLFLVDPREHHSQ